jgi:acetyl-CoA acetyltransferase
MPHTEAFIIDAVRTPIGKYGGILRDVRPDDLSGLVIRSLIERTKLDPKLIQDVLWGCANQAGEDNRNIGRMAALLAGLPYSVPASTVNRLCGSSLDAINQAARAIWSDDLEIVIAGGVESMSRAPYSIPKNQSGSYGNVTAYDTSLGWRYPNPKLERMFPLESMGETAENIAEKYKISREEQDEFAYNSHAKAVKAQKDCKFQDEIIPVDVSAQKKIRALKYNELPESSKLSEEDKELYKRYHERFAKPREETEQQRMKIVDGKTYIIVNNDEGPRADTSIDKLSKLQPVFRKNGTVTSGNSSSLNDGAAAVLIVSERKVKQLGLQPIGRIIATGVAGVDPRYMGIGPVPAVEIALQKSGLTMNHLDLIELNEAFAAQSIAVIRDLHLDPVKLNPNGGAIALGHPLGCSGARIMTTLLHEMKRRKSRYGLATMCIGVGQGIATIVENSL